MSTFNNDRPFVCFEVLGSKGKEKIYFYYQAAVRRGAKAFLLRSDGYKLGSKELWEFICSWYGKQVAEPKNFSSLKILKDLIGEQATISFTPGNKEKQQLPRITEIKPGGSYVVWMRKNNPIPAYLKPDFEPPRGGKPSLFDELDKKFGSEE